ncbi:MAG: hypothetical protein MRJ93_09505 [Nitrososphaeraceae archaeon]|nr:hypothetical protein [Nitrososphaeraceae archaeon]
MTLECIYNHWIHSYEEDSLGKKVYRPSTFKFPPSRGRQGFEIKRNGTFVQYIIGRTDRQEKLIGTYKFLDQNTLSISLSDERQQKISFQLKILSCDKNILVIEKN